MHLKQLFLMTAGLFITVTLSQELNISGKITGQNNTGIEGCQVLMSNVTAKTGSDGAFVLQGKVSGLFTKPLKHQLIAQYEDPFLNYQIEANHGDVDISLEDIRGNNVLRIKDKRVSKGQYFLDIRQKMEKLSATSIYFLRVKIGAEEKVFKIPTLDMTRSESHSAGNAALRKTTAVTETMTISCKGYLPKKQVVPSYSGSIGTIVLKKPNILFLMADDMNSWLSFTNGRAKTPNLDKFSKSGVFFSNAHAAAQECSPSRISMWTGLRPSTSAMYWNRDKFRTSTSPIKNVVTLPQYLKQNGYTTISVGKIFHNPTGEESDPISWDLQNGANSTTVPDALNAGNPAIVIGASAGTKEETGDYRGAKFTADFLKESHAKPFLIALGNFRPHWPLVAPQEYFDSNPLSEVKLPDVKENDLDDVGAFAKTVAHNFGANTHAQVLKQGIWKKAIQGYQACVQFVDANMGMVLDALENSEYRDNTIVIFTSDHGVHLGTKEHWWKMDLWHETTQIPLIIRVPGITPTNVISKRTVDMQMLYPTLVELLGLPPKEGVDGRSIVPLLENPMKEWPYPAVVTAGYRNHAVISEDYRYITYNDGASELYDKKTDSLEWYNVAGEAKHSATINHLKTFLPKINAPEIP